MSISNFDSGREGSFTNEMEIKQKLTEFFVAKIRNAADHGILYDPRCANLNNLFPQTDEYKTLGGQRRMLMLEGQAELSRLKPENCASDPMPKRYFGSGPDYEARLIELALRDAFKQAKLSNRPADERDASMD